MTRAWPRVLFLDLDDVICLRQRAFDLFEALHDRPADIDELCRNAFSRSALQLLEQLLQIERVVVVVSSSWRMSFDRSQFEDVLERCRAGFVVPALHRDWCTERLGDRLLEIRAWLVRHRGEVESWAAIDDHESGRSLGEFAFYRKDHLDVQRLVLCEAARGLTEQEAVRIRAALTLPLSRARIAR